VSQVRGLALPGVEAFTTPLGEVPVDGAAVEALGRLPQVVVSPNAHAQEHSLEVQLPFLQTVLDTFTLVPLAVGDATPDEVAEVLETVWGGAETLIVISSDLSHYLSHAQAQAVDRQSIQTLLALQPTLSHRHLRRHAGQWPAAGRTSAWPETAVARLAQFRRHGRGLAAVVGYAAVAFHEAAPRPAGLWLALSPRRRRNCSRWPATPSQRGWGARSRLRKTRLRPRGCRRPAPLLSR
jgi:hypothetical protein